MSGRARPVSAAVLAALAGAMLAGCGGASHHAGTTTSSHTTVPHRAGPPTLDFAESGKGLAFARHGTVRRGGIEVIDVSYASPGGRVTGYLVERRGAAHRPAVVLVHGAGGNRGELLSSAEKLAALGAVALTITEPSTAHPLPTPTTNDELLAEARETTVRDVVAVRRAADVLRTLPAVDPGRIGYLGWSNGAKVGAFVAASDPGFKAFALLSGGADPLSAFVAAAPAKLRPKVKLVLGSVDPLRYVALARPGTVLLEDGTRDAIVPHEALLNFVHAAPKGTEVRWYPTGHALDSRAYSAAFAWLLAKLG